MGANIINIVVTSDVGGIYTKTYTITVIRGCESRSPVNKVSSCSSYTWNGVSYTTSGTYIYRPGLITQAGCDTVATLELTILQPTTSTTAVSNCGSYNWNGVNYTTSGTYTKIFIGGNSKGCDSIATLILTVVNVTNTVGIASSTPILCINTSLTNITHTTTGASGIGVATGLPIGVVANWANNVITISGMPNESGIFNYSIPLLGGCGNIYATGTVTVIGLNTVNAVSSGSVCINTPLADITNTTTGATGIGIATGLPTGVRALWANSVLTISGTPTASGAYNYSIPLIGGCGIINAVGNIRVAANNTVSIASSTDTLCVNTVLADITHQTTGARDIGTPTGLPAGLNASWVVNNIIIKGTPTVSGVFNYSIPLTGGCSAVNATGIITVKAASTSSTPISVCINALPYTWNGTAYSVAGTYTKTLASVVGCDSVASLVLTITPSITPSVSIAANPGNSITRGTAVTFTATPSNGGTTPAYQWKKNNNNVGSNSVTYTDAALENSDIITCVLTSNNPCASPVTATSTGITIAVSYPCPSGTTWTSSTSAADNQWRSVTYGNGLFVGVSDFGSNNLVMTSPDGITWTGRTSADNSWQSVTYGNGVFVAVANSGSGSAGVSGGDRVMTSPDGINWGNKNVAAIQWQSVTYGNGLFVAVATSGIGSRVMTSPNGSTWTSRTSAADNAWQSVTYGNGVFVAVSNTGTGKRVMTSPDGIAWTIRTSAADNAWQSVTYGKGVFVAVAASGTGNRVMTSPDGITWTIRTSAADNNWNSVSYGNGSFVAVAYSGTGNRVMTSPDGITWTSRTSAADNNWRSVTYGAGSFVAVSTTGTGNRVMTSAPPLVSPSVTIAANPGNSILTGTSVTFTATPTNEGTTPAYQWKKNGNNVGSNSVTYTDATLANGDIVTCVLTSNNPCASSTIATSTGITMVVRVATLDNLGLTSRTLATVAYSLRLLNSGYTGPLARITIGSNYYDVYPDATTNQFALTSKISAAYGTYNAPATGVTTNALSSVIGSSSATVAIWYDQSSNATNLTQTTTANQPRIINAGVIDVENGKPFIRFFGVVTNSKNSLDLASGLSTNGQIVAVNKFASGGDGFLLGAASTYYWHSGPNTNLFSSANVSTSINNATVYQNGVSISTSTAVWNTVLGINSIAPQTPSTGTFWDNIGSDRGILHVTTGGGGYAELLSFPTALSVTDRQAVEASQTAYYSIGSVTWVGTTSAAWATASNWSTNEVPPSASLVTIPSGTPFAPNNTGAVTVASLTVASGGVTVTNTGTINVTGALSNSGTITGTVILNGSSAQTISGTGIITNLTLNNSAGATISSGTTRITDTYTPTVGVLNTGGNLILASTAAGTASIAAGNGTYITGNVTMQRYTRAQRGYRTFGHPFSSAQNLGILTDNFRITGLSTNAGNGTFATSAGNPSAFLYDPTQIVGSINVLTRLTDATANIWERGKGLYVFVRGAGNEGAGGAGANNYSGGHNPLTLDGTGAINQGDVTVNLGYGGIGRDNYNLIGNPYPCPINLKTVTNIGSYGTVYVYNPIKNTAGADQYTLSGGFDQYTNNGSNNIIIPAFGGFYIQATGNGQSLTFKESDKTIGGTPNFTVFGTDKQPLIRLAVANDNGTIDELSFGINNGSTDASTDKYDAAKLGNSLFNFYSLASDKKWLAIDYRANLNSVIPLGIQTSLNNTYTIALSELTDLPNTQVVLRDKLLKTETILSQVGDSYSFAITADTATKGENRFEIGLLGTTVLPVQIADITAQLQTNKTVAVNWTSTTEVNLANYKVQRSKDGSNFSTVGTVAAKGASTYNYNDDLNTAGVLPATIYYRLEALDKDGSKTYSKVVSCQLPVAVKSISIYPNPVQATLFAQVTVTKAGAAQLKVVDAHGKVVATQKTQLAVGTTSVTIPAAQLSAGSYVLEIETADGKQTQRFVKE